MLSDTKSMFCLQPPGHSDRLPEHNPQSACSPVFKEEEGECGDYDLYGTEHCLQVSLFNEKQNNPSGTQSSFMSSVGEENISASYHKIQQTITVQILFSFHLKYLDS